MIRNLQLITSHSQMKELGSSLKFNILKELIKAPATCQQLSDLFDHSKQKVHYNLTQMVAEDLIEIADAVYNNNREVYYRATAKSYVLDFAIGLEANGRVLDSRAIIGGILEQEHSVSLSKIAAKLIDQSFGMIKGERLLIVSGKFNFPLVEKLLQEAGSRGINTSLIYQDKEHLRAKYEDYSLSAFKADYEEMNRLLKISDVYLNLNGESRSVQLLDPEKIILRNRQLEKSRKIIQEKHIRVAMMPGLLHDTLTEKAIESELQFWQALDIDYPRLCKHTIGICKEYSAKETLEIATGEAILHFEAQRFLAECGSFGSNEFQSPVINLPGGEILIIPKPDSMNGSICADRAFVFGEEILKPHIEIRNSKIISFTAQKGEQLIAKAIADGGEDGDTVALIGLGTNDSIRQGDIDNALKHKSSGFLTVFWGDNRSLGGSVAGTQEWFLQVENPIINFQKKKRTP
ncbi:MAG: aminopeptidase [Candidatus Cloacimonetes bacterium]|nr:aminopeptidase [Candidatus Cloacimonadota bacterium]